MTKKDLPSPELLRKLLRYEPDTGKLFWKERSVDMFASENAFGSWNTRYSGKEAFTSINGMGYKHGTIFNVTYSSHRAIWAIYYGYWPSSEIDHINGEKCDNRIKNLRDVDHYVNMKNRSMSNRNKSGHTGVHWDKNHKKWRSEVSINGKRKHIGLFYSIDDAIRSRIEAENTHGYTNRHGL